MSDLDCPYCGHPVDDDDLWQNVNGDECGDDMECIRCGLEFHWEYRTVHIFEATTYKLDPREEARLLMMQEKKCQPS